MWDCFVFFLYNIKVIHRVNAALLTSCIIAIFVNRDCDTSVVRSISCFNTDITVAAVASNNDVLVAILPPVLGMHQNGSLIAPLVELFASHTNRTLPDDFPRLGHRPSLGCTHNVPRL